MIIFKRYFLIDNVCYWAEEGVEDFSSRKYFGSFKRRHSNHVILFRFRRYVIYTALLKYIWEIKDEKEEKLNLTWGYFKLWLKVDLFNNRDRADINANCTVRSTPSGECMFQAWTQSHMPWNWLSLLSGDLSD